MGKQAKIRAKRRADGGVQRALKRNGVHARVRALEMLFQRPDFRAHLNERMVAVKGTPEDPADLQGVRDMAFSLARDKFGIDTTDCLLTLDWQPDLGRKLMPEFGPSIEAVQRAQAEAAAEARRGRAA